MNKQDIIISLLKEIDKNIDNVNDSGGTNTNIKVKVNSFRVTDDCINEDGRWEGESLIDTSNCYSFQDCFLGCSKLKRIDVNLKTSNCSTFYRTFSGTGLQYLNTSLWDTSKVTNMQEMFVMSKELTEIDTKNWNVSNVTNTHNMFGSCYKLQSLIGNTTLEDVLSNNISCLNGYNAISNMYIMNTMIDRASLRAFINGLADLTGQTAQTLTLGATLIAKLTEEDIAIATAKNWTIA